MMKKTNKTMGFNRPTSRKALLRFVLLFASFFALLLSACRPSYNDPLSELKKIRSETGDLYLSRDVSSFAASGVEWALIGLRAEGRLTDGIRKTYLAAAENTIREKDSNRMNPTKSSENARMILGITAAGGDPAALGDRNLLEGLAEMSYVRAQGNNGPIWALIAFDSGAYEIPEAEEEAETVTRERLVDVIVSAQRDDGGYTIMNGKSDVDLTAMAVTALAPYREKAEVRDAIERALKHLSERQEADGGFEGYGVRTSESVSQVIIALSSVGLDPVTDERFLKEGHSLTDALLTFHVEGGFKHEKKEDKANAIATEQAYLALSSVIARSNGGDGIYDFRSK